MLTVLGTAHVARLRTSARVQSCVQDARHADGFEAAFRVPARASELQRARHDVVNLCIGQPEFQTPDHIIEAGARHWRMGITATRSRMVFCRCVRWLWRTTTDAIACRSHRRRCW